MNDLPIIDSLVMYLLAVAIAFLVALVIKGIVAITGRIGEGAPAKAPVAKPAAAKPAAVPAGPPPAHIAAITAAVASFLGTHRIVRIADAAHDTTWTTTGRAQQQLSHRPHSGH
ncbi:MAG: hypothetical protein H6843_02020 [Rhodospirillaceae bacterium]|nr:hypothetical protein [Rhodospirillaceae bacterium]